MGASGWSYFVPYQKDINRALQDLKDEVFKRGQYEKPFEFDVNELERQREFLASIYRTLPEGLLREQSMRFLDLAGAAAKHQRPRRKPKTIKQLLEQSEENGTHSILDIERVADTKAFGAVVPLSKQQLLEFFGTEQPGREALEKWSRRVDLPEAEPLYERWEGIYVIVYKDSAADEIYFEGCSGD
jgi:hypothetical protein